jgi:hypothetical protein
MVQQSALLFQYTIAITCSEENSQHAYSIVMESAKLVIPLTGAGTGI